VSILLALRLARKTVLKPGVKGFSLKMGQPRSQFLTKLNQAFTGFSIGLTAQLAERKEEHERTVLAVLPLICTKD